MTTTSNIETIIKDLAKQAFNSYPEVYNSEFPEKCAESISELAKGYWDNRTEDEIERDENAGVDVNDYERWCAAAYEATIET
jgi:hypothetical protein